MSEFNPPYDEEKKASSTQNGVGRDRAGSIEIITALVSEGKPS